MCGCIMFWGALEVHHGYMVRCCCVVVGSEAHSPHHDLRSWYGVRYRLHGIGARIIEEMFLLQCFFVVVLFKLFGLEFLWWTFVVWRITIDLVLTRPPWVVLGQTTSDVIHVSRPL